MGGGAYKDKWNGSLNIFDKKAQQCIIHSIEHFIYRKPQTWSDLNCLRGERNSAAAFP